MLPNVPQFAVTMAAVLRAGYTGERELAVHRARAAAPARTFSASAIVILENFAHTLAEVVEHSAVRMW